VITKWSLVGIIVVSSCGVAAEKKYYYVEMPRDGHTHRNVHHTSAILVFTFYTIIVLCSSAHIMIISVRDQRIVLCWASCSCWRMYEQIARCIVGRQQSSSYKKYKPTIVTLYIIHNVIIIIFVQATLRSSTANHV
jgi:hypothetical protein